MIHGSASTPGAAQEMRAPGSPSACSIEIAAIHAEERDDLPESALQRRVEIAGRHVDQPGRQVGEQRLEPQALLQEEPCPAP